MISLFVAALLWFRDMRNLGRSLGVQDPEMHDPYGLLHTPTRPQVKLRVATLGRGRYR